MSDSEGGRKEGGGREGDQDAGGTAGERGEGGKFKPGKIKEIPVSMKDSRPSTFDSSGASGIGRQQLFFAASRSRKRIWERIDNFRIAARHCPAQSSGKGER